MSDSSQPFTFGWKIAVVIALIVALANSGLSKLQDRENDRFENHEARIDELENSVFGNDIGTAPREESHAARLKTLEQRLDASGGLDGDIRNNE